MGIDALTLNASAKADVPSSREEWDAWVSATATRNFVLGNPLIDWLARHGAAAGFDRDDASSDHDPRTDFTSFIMRKGIEFEAAIAAHLATLRPLIKLSATPGEVRDLAVAERTFAAMAGGAPIIHQGVLRDAATRTYGAPDFLVRSDVLSELFPGAIDDDEAARPAPGLGGERWHYVVVDAKFTTVHLLAGGGVGNSGSAPAFKAQLFIYNRALGRLQDYEPREAFLLGRGIEHTVQGQTHRSSSAMEELGPVSMDDDALGMRVAAACEWVRRVRTEGARWSALPLPSVHELWPNMSETADFPWHDAKAKIAHDLSELTLLWQVGPDKRDAAHRAGITSWRDERLSPAAVGIVGGSRGPVLQALLDANRDDGGPPVRPAHVRAHEADWRPVPALEFYVDFETVSDLNDDFAEIPARGGQPLIFMIGCGHTEDGRWVFEQFVAERLSEEHEALAIEAWVAHMASLAAAHGMAEPGPYVIHWSPAERSTLETAYNSARNRHPGREWPAVRWFDCWKNVALGEPVVVRGALNFGLKSVAKALHALGIIESSWEDSPLDGLGAMVGAWWCDGEAARTGARLGDVELMREIGRYNEIDCKGMMEVIRYLREHH